MHRVVALLALSAAACGRLAFDPLRDGQTDGDPTGARSIVLPDGGQMQQVYVASNGIWYAAATNSGAFRSMDQGMSWTPCGPRLGGSIAVTTDGVVWLAGAVVGRSTDNCATWTDTTNVTASDYVYALGANLWALCVDGLRVWNGSTFQVVTTPVAGRLTWMSRMNGRYFIGTTMDGLVTSTDAMTWSQIPMGTAFASVTVEQVAGGTNHTYAITAGSANNIACSNGTAAVWTDCSVWGGLAITVDPTDDAHAIVAPYDNLGETTNAFASFTPGLREISMDSANVEDIHYEDTGELLAATDRGIFRAPAGTVAFQPRHTGIQAWDIDGIARDATDVWAWSRGGVLHSSGGAPFQVRTGGITGNTEVRHVRVMPDGRVLAAGRNLYISDDRGDTWTMLLQTDANDSFHASDVAFVGDRMFVATGARLQFADPPYTTWTISTFPGGPYPADVLLVASDIGVWPGRIWIGTDRGLRFTDGGTGIFSVTDIGTRVVRDLLELSDGRIVAATQDGVWISNTSTFVRAGLDGLYVDGLTLVNDTLIAATAVGVRYSRDAGMTWTPMPGAEAIPSSATLFDDTTGQLIVGTDSRGLIRVPMP